MRRLAIKTGAVAIGIALAAAPAFAERNGRRHENERGGSKRIERAQPRGRVESRGRAESRGPYDKRSFASRSSDYRSDTGRSHDNRSFGNRDHAYSYSNRGYDYRSSRTRGYGYRSYYYGSYGYRPYVRSYAVPYGYRPNGYRPGWSLNLYFGRPYSTYAYPTYDYGYSSAVYGYYSLIPGRSYGALRIVDAPRDAQVFVDGYYAGVVDDYDGVFQHLNLETGPHHVEIQEPGYPPIAFEVQIQPGQTITYRANLR